MYICKTEIYFGSQFWKSKSKVLSASGKDHMLFHEWVKVGMCACVEDRKGTDTCFIIIHSRENPVSRERH